jgi:hypothetical protein
VQDIDFEVISAVENLNKFQKTRFWKEKSVEDVVTLGPNGTGHTIVSNQKNTPMKGKILYNLGPKKSRILGSKLAHTSGSSKKGTFQ